MWSKDVSRILPLTDCGVTESACVDEPGRASLIRDIYAFLDLSVSNHCLFLLVLMYLCSLPRLISLLILSSSPFPITFNCCSY